MTAPDLSTYRPYRNLPPLAGLATLAGAVRRAMGVEECVSRLKCFHYAFVRLHEIFTARITAEPIYELKTGFSHHSYLCAEHTQALRARVGEMREPPLGLEVVPHPALQVFFDEILAAPNTEALLVGLYEKALPALDAAMSEYLADTNPLCDAPSIRVCRFARLELADMIAFGRKCVECLVDSEKPPHPQPLAPVLGGEGSKRRPPHPRPLSPEYRGEGSRMLDRCLAAAGGFGGTGEAGDVPERMHSKPPYVYDPAPKRDERFSDPYNQGVNAEAFLYDDAFDARPKALMMFFKRLREIDVPEMMASIITQTRGKPWEYYRAMSRQLWDEARHAMMGEVGFASQGVDWTKARVTYNWSMRLNTECSPIERHAVLFFIEQGLMTKTGKRYEWEVGGESGIPLARTFQDFDWADEVLHAQLGREWYVKEMGDLKTALAYGDECWSRILSNWRTVLEQGLTKHENWWPGIYEQACRAWGVEPDAKALAFGTTYEGRRADLKPTS